MGLHQVFTARGAGEVELPYALERKYPNAKDEWGWQYVFPAKNICTDPVQELVDDTTYMKAHCNER